MKRTLLAIAMLALALPVVAGEEWNCDKGTQECLDGMVGYFKNKGYIGVELDHETMAVKEVVAGTPAAKVGVKVGDIWIGVDGNKVSEMTKEDHHALSAKLTPGSTLWFTVERKGKVKEFKVTLAEMPAEQIAKYLGEHMMEHAQVASN